MIDFSNNPKMSDVYPFLAEAIKDGGQFVLFPRGTSMKPSIIQGEDCVVLVEIDKLSRYDIVLYTRKSGQFVLHRIMDIKDGQYIMCGDNQHDFEYGIERSSIIAVVQEIRKKDGRVFDIEQIHLDGKKFHTMPKKRLLRLYSKLRKYVKERILCNKK